MSRKFDRTLQINKKAMTILEDPATISYLASKLIRRRPGYFPKILWKALLFIVLAPETRKRPNGTTS
jgi:hypothetical protein